LTRRSRRIKIIATLGPASADRETVAALFKAGADVFRINMSHASHDGMRERVALIRSLEEEFGRPIGILVDLQGPKLRVGTFHDGAESLRKGDSFTLDSDPKPGGPTRVFLPHPEILASVEPGHRVLIDDGKVLLRVSEVAAGRADCVVEVAGKISNKKGVSLPDTTLPTSAMTPKDRADLDAALDENIDWIALSFVQRPEDVAEARKLVANRAGIMVKLEKPAGVRRLAEIIELSDAIMVARGDLGVEMPPEDVPPIQRQIVHASRLAGKPVIVATQMLESMIHSPVPTRAEASDVATAVYEGADAVMLSAETAAGDFPVEAVAMMDRIARRVQADPLYNSSLHTEMPEPEHTSSDAISAAARQVAHTIGAAAICSYTTSGATALRAARERPDVPILALTSNLQTARRLALVWGLHCVHSRDVTNFSDMVHKATRTAHREGFAEKGQRIVVTAGVPFGTPGATNVLRIA
jgi:pyruvate kinase